MNRLKKALPKKFRKRYYTAVHHVVNHALEVYNTYNKKKWEKENCK